MKIQGRNRVEVHGNVSRMDIRHTSAGKTYCTFTVASNFRYKDDAGEWQDGADFISCVAFGKIAELMEKNLQVGHAFVGVGAVKTTSRGEGDEKKWFTNINIREWSILQWANDSDSKPVGDVEGKTAGKDFDDDIPF